MLRCENCGFICEFKKLGLDEEGDIILECRGCGAVCYEDGTLIEDVVTIVRQ